MDQAFVEKAKAELIKVGQQCCSIFEQAYHPDNNINLLPQLFLFGPQQDNGDLPCMKMPSILVDMALAFDSDGLMTAIDKSLLAGPDTKFAILVTESRLTEYNVETGKEVDKFDVINAVLYMRGRMMIGQAPIKDGKCGEFQILSDGSGEKPQLAGGLVPPSLKPKNEPRATHEAPTTLQ